MKPQPLCMINDLCVHVVGTWKFVDNTTISEVVCKGKDANMSNESHQWGRKVERLFSSWVSSPGDKSACYE